MDRLVTRDSQALLDFLGQWAPPVRVGQPAARERPGQMDRRARWERQVPLGQLASRVIQGLRVSRALQVQPGLKERLVQQAVLARLGTRAMWELLESLVTRAPLELADLRDSPATEVPLDCPEVLDLPETWVLQARAGVAECLE